MPRQMQNPEENYEEEPQEQMYQGAVAPPQAVEDAGFWADQARNAPAWLISVAAHAILIFLATAITFTVTKKAVEEPTIISAPPVKIEKLPEPEKPRGIFEKKGLESNTQQPTEEPKIFFPGAEESDHNESANNEDYGQMKGESYEALSYLPGEAGEGIKGRGQGAGPGVYDSIGVGGGGGGSKRYGGRFGGRRNLVARGGGSGTESAVEHALRWLCRHQDANGGWNASSFASNCVGGTKCSGPGSEEFSVGASSLALLAFLGRGYTHLSREVYFDKIANKTFKYGEVVKKAVQYLISQQDADGCIGKVGQKYMYNTSAATLALAEAYGMTSEKQFEEPGKKAVNYIIEAQNRGAGGGDYDRRGWRYTYRCGENDTSVMGWCVMALKSADMSGLFSGHGSAAFGGAISWVKDVTDDGNDYRVGYTAKGTGKVSVRGINDQWADHDALTAIGMLTRIFINKDKNDPALAGGAKRLMTDANMPKWDNSGGEKQIDYYHWYYSTLAVFQFDGPDGPNWKKWNEPMKKALLPNQHVTSDGCLDGSWDPEVDRWGFEGGRVYATAINALTLEVYYRYDAVFMKH